MKYIGSKRAMLQNGLAELLATEVTYPHRFVDLFTGSGLVAWYVAERKRVPVLAYDLQLYSVTLAQAVIGRTAGVDYAPLWAAWRRRAKRRQDLLPTPPGTTTITPESVAGLRAWSAKQVDLPITRAYGGHYYSPVQTVWLDALRATLPTEEPDRTVALAALIHAASQSVAAPGHTAQPFQPTPTATKYIEEAWAYSIPDKTRLALKTIAVRHGLRNGRAIVADANESAKSLVEGDLAFIDPPYSGVHYSRFYHVLESIAQGAAGETTGVGRYPAIEKRPSSDYSLKTKSVQALNGLLSTVASRRARAILTFPDKPCTNGLSGRAVLDMADQHFVILKRQVHTSFSTLGGRGDNRKARQPTDELLLLLRPR